MDGNASESDVLARVARGAALLDERCPGWERRIDLEALNIASDCQCVLGQIYGSYCVAFDDLIPDDDPEFFGFVANDKGDCIAIESAWCALITARLNPD